MSAIEQPAARFGRITTWCSAERMSALSAMKWTPQKTMYSASRRPAACSRELERVAAEVGVLDDLVALVVVAEDHEPVAEALPERRRFARPARRLTSAGSVLE